MTGAVHTASSSASLFVGADRHAIVDRLRSRLESICEGQDIPRIVVLRGESGVGKSRIVREFYRRLTSEQSVNRAGIAYWPPLPDADPDPAKALPFRKQLGPDLAEFLWPADTVPSFTWWDLYCQQTARNGLQDVTFALDFALSAHGEAILCALSDQAAWRSRYAELREIVRNVIAEASVETALLILAQNDIALPYSGAAIAGAKTAMTSWQRNRKAHALRKSDVAYSKNHEEVAATLAGRIAQFSRPELPAIIVIEDLHLMGPDLAALLDALSTRSDEVLGNPVMVVATAWPESKQDSHFARWLQSAMEDGDVDPGDWEVRPLPNADLISLLREVAPATDPELAATVVSRWSNPLALKMFLSLDSVRKRVVDGALTITDEQLGTFPRDIRRLYEDRFASLSSSTQAALALASGTLPSGSSSLKPFMRPIVAQAAATSGVLSDMPVTADAQLQPEFDEAAETRWLAEQLGMAHAFIDLPLVLTAREDLEGRLDSDERQSLAGRTMSSLAEYVKANVPPSRQSGGRPPGMASREEEIELTVACQWFLALVDEAPSTAPDPDPLAVASARLYIGRRVASGGDLEGSVAAAKPQETAERLGSAPMGTETIQAAEEFASWLESIRRNDEQGAFLSTIAGSWAPYGPMDARTMAELWRAAGRAWHRAGNPEQQIIALQESLRYREQLGDMDGASVAALHRGMATALDRVGRAQLAAEHRRLAEAAHGTVAGAPRREPGQRRPIDARAMESLAKKGAPEAPVAERIAVFQSLDLGDSRDSSPGDRWLIEFINPDAHDATRHRIADELVHSVRQGSASQLTSLVSITQEIVLSYPLHLSDQTIPLADGVFHAVLDNPHARLTHVHKAFGVLNRCPWPPDAAQHMIANARQYLRVAEAWTGITSADSRRARQSLAERLLDAGEKAEAGILARINLSVLETDPSSKPSELKRARRLADATT